MGNSHAIGRGSLGQPKAPDRSRNFDQKTSFDLQFICGG
jgi:hypothetical protein